MLSSSPCCWGQPNDGRPVTMRTVVVVAVDMVASTKTMALKQFMYLEVASRELVSVPYGLKS